MADERIDEFISKLDTLIDAAMPASDVSLSVQARNDEVVLRDNRLGLLMLAQAALRASNAEIAGWHMHIDEASFADPGSLPLVIALSTDGA
jgi:hypothetical protein